MLYYIYICFLAVSFACSLYRFKILPIHLKLLSVLLGVCLITELLAMPFLSYFHLTNNNPIYNCYLLLECCGYAYYYKLIIQSNRSQKIISFFLVLFPAFWFITTFYVFGFKIWNSYVAVVESLFVVCFSAVYYHQLFIAEKTIALQTNSEFWIATAMILFYACNLPYLGMLGYLVKNFLQLSRILLNLLQILNIIMYSLISYAFLCRINTRKSL